jgi:hypothetical protein
MATTTKQSDAPTTVKAPTPTKAEQAALAKAAKAREAAQHKLAETIAKERANKVPWDGTDPDKCIVPRLVASATTGRALLKRYGLVDKAGGIGAGYNRAEAKAKRESASKS